MDKDLKDLLRKWELPDPPPELDDRVMAAYQRRRRPWSFGWAGSVRLPAPVFALLLLLQLVSGAVILSGRMFSLPTQAPVLSMPERVVQVPVVKEKTVTRLVYLPATNPAGSDGRAVHSTANAESEKQLMDLTGFQPVSEFQIHVIKGGNLNER